MPEERAKRKLTAIFSADVKGYSRLMGEDEAGTVRTLESYRTIMTNVIERYRGRVVDSPGDNLLAEFASVVDALESAKEIQQALKSKNQELPENRRMEFRIGINLGDVIEEGPRIYGDGVNVAARIEGLADPGGICISRMVFDQVKNKLNLGFEYLGEHPVKNIQEPVRVYRVLMEPEHAGKVIGELKPVPKKRMRPAIATLIIVLILAAAAFAVWNRYLKEPPIEPASLEKMAFPLPDKPSIAVLPFVNMSDDPKQEFFSDGITEDIITALSKTPRLFVIARNSTFVYKGKSVKIQQVAEDLGVRYVLEGSVRKSEDSVRVTAQLIDALKGTHLWADKYDRNLKDIFTIQDDITREIIAALQVELTEGEQARIWSRGTQNEKAYEAALESLEHFRRFNPDDVILCRKKAQEALALDPNYPFATALLAWSHLIEVWNGWTKSPGESLKKAAELGRKTIALDENYEGGHALLGSVYLVQKRWDEAIEKGQRAVELSPSGADANGIFGITLCHVGRPQEAISLFKKAIRLNPSSPNWLYHNLGVAQIMAGNYQAATASLNRVIEKNPDHIPARFYKIVALSLSNQEEEARNQIEEYFNLRPNASIENWRKRITFRKETDIELFANALNKVGFPKTPPLPLPDKPSIAVLPFVNMSGDLDQEYFSDGITEEIITALSKTPKLFVIARNSTFTYKGKPVWIPTVGKELGVRYVLEGSVRRADNQVRVTAQLIDAKTNQHLWAERWDRDLEDIFSVQDEITHKIITAMQIKLTEGEQARLWGKNVRRLDVFLKLMEARSLAAEGTAESRIRFGQVAREVIDLAPESQVGYDLLAWHHWWLAMYGKSPPENLKKSFALAQKLLSMNEFSASAHSLLGSIYLLMREYEKAIAAGEKSIELQPNGAMAHLLLGNTLSYVERPDEAIFHIKQGIRLNPFPTYHYFFNLARCYILKGRYEEALAEYKRAMELAPGNWPTLAGMTVVYSLLGRKNKAGEAAERLLEANPKYSVHLFTQTAPYKSQDRVTQFANALRKAGLK